MAWYSLKKPLFELRALEEPVPHETTLLLQGAGVPGFRQALQRVNGELHRARRYQRPLAVAIFGYDDLYDRSITDEGITDIATTAEHALFPAILAALLQETTRETDIVTYRGAQGRSIVVMPETGTPEAMQAVNRLRDLCAARLRIPVRAGFAVFPEHGLTLEELLRYAGEDATRCVREGTFVPSIQNASPLTS